jgi:hypothetical protein
MYMVYTMYIVYSMYIPGIYRKYGFQVKLILSLTFYTTGESVD